MGSASWRLALRVAGLVCACSVGVCAQASDPGAAMAEGKKAMQAGDFTEAVSAFTEVTRDLPTFAEGYFNLGLAVERQGKLDQADSVLKKALELKPGLAGANLFRGIIAYRQNRFKDAEALLSRETSAHPRDASAWMWLGVCRLAENDPSGAIEPLEKAHRLAPTDADILYHRGHAYLEMANQSYGEMYKLDRDSARVHQVLAEAYASGFRNQEAIGEYQIAVKMAPRQPGLHEDLADQYWIAGQTDEAAEAYRQELNIDACAATAMYKLGSLLVLSGKADDGVAALRDALHVDPSLSDAHYYLAEGFGEQGQNDDAIAEFNAAIHVEPDSERAMMSYYKLAQVYRKLHRTDDAKTALDNFQRLRADVKTRQDSHTAQIVRNRSQLPVADPESAGARAEP